MIDFDVTYDSLNKYHHYLVLHIDGLNDDLIKKNFNYIVDNPKIIMIKDGKNILYGNYTDEDKKTLDDYTTFNDDFIIIKNPSYVYECFSICYDIFDILKPYNKVADVISHVDILKHGTKNIFRVFSGKTHYLSIDNHQEKVETSFNSDDYIIIRTGFTSKIDKKKLEHYLERYKFLPYFMFLKDKDVILKNEDVFTPDSPRRIEELEVKELMENLESFIKADINDGFIAFAGSYSFKIVIQFLHMLKEFNYCSIKGLKDVSRVAKLEFGDYKRALYLRLDCEEI